LNGLVVMQGGHGGRGGNGSRGADGIHATDIHVDHTYSPVTSTVTSTRSFDVMALAQAQVSSVVFCHTVKDGVTGNMQIIPLAEDETRTPQLVFLTARGGNGGRGGDGGASSARILSSLPRPPHSVLTLERLLGEQAMVEAVERATEAAMPLGTAAGPTADPEATVSGTRRAFWTLQKCWQVREQASDGRISWR
jgi:hypothetical protein